MMLALGRELLGAMRELIDAVRELARVLGDRQPPTSHGGTDG